jgi:hypothetical protein
MNFSMANSKNLMLNNSEDFYLKFRGYRSRSIGKRNAFVAGVESNLCLMMILYKVLILDRLMENIHL